MMNKPVGDEQPALIQTVNGHKYVLLGMTAPFMWLLVLIVFLLGAWTGINSQ